MSINNGAEASAFIFGVKSSHQDLWDRVEATEAYLLHGETPFTAEELEEDGQDWVPNYNYGKGRAEVEQGVINNQTDIYRSFALVDVEFQTYDRKKHNKNIHAFLMDDYMKGVLKRILAYSFINCIEEDERTHPFISQIEYYSFTFGYCPILRHDWNYLGDVVPLGSIGFQDRTKVGELRDFVIFDSIKVDDIYSAYKNNKKRKGKKVEYLGECYHVYPDGWVQEGMLDILKSKIDLLNLDENYNEIKKDDKRAKRLVIETWDNVDEFITRKGINYLSCNSSNIYIGKIFCWEDNNTFEECHCIIDSVSDESGNVNTVSDSRQYLLYKKTRKRERQSEILTLVKEFGISKDCYISSLRGAGKFIAEEALRYDTKRNTIEAKLMLNGSPFFKANNSLSGAAAKIKVTHGYVIVDDEVQILPDQVRYNITDQMNSLAMEDQEYQKRVYHLNPKMDLSSRPTSDEVNTRSKEVSNLRMSKVPIKLADYGRLFTECLYDLVTKEYDNDENKAMQDTFFEYVRCYLLKYGLDFTNKEIIEIVKCVKCVKMNPALGDAGAIREAMEFVSNSDQRKYLTIMYLLALGFSRKNAWEYVEVEDYGDQIDKAAMENSMFYDTSEVSVGRHQDPLSHLNTHFAKADRVMKGVVGGEDPVRAFNWMTNCLINTAKHIEFLEVNPFYKKQYKQFVGVQQFFEGKAKKLSGLVKQMQQEQTAQAEQNIQGQQQQQQQGLSAETRAKLYQDEVKMMEKIKRTNMLTEHAMSKKNEMFELQKELAKRNTDSNIQMQKEFAELKTQLALLQESVKLAK